MIKVIETNVIIMGAGPAGAGTSFFLSKAFVPHIVLEKEIFPRDKICGDACGPRTIFVLNEANPAWLEELNVDSGEFLSNKGAIFTEPKGKNLEIPFGYKHSLWKEGSGFTSKRFVFDHFLFKKIESSFSTVYQGISLKNIEKAGDSKIKVSFTWSGDDYEILAPLILGADGDKSHVRKIFYNHNRSSKTSCIAVRAYYKGVTGMSKENFIELHYLDELLPGYFWIFPLPNGTANVGIGIPARTVKKKKINLRELMQDIIKNNPAIRHRFTDAVPETKVAGWGLPISMGRQDLSGDHFLLAGDAACLINPFTGEGIGNALYSGMLAARAIVDSLKEKNYTGNFLREKYDIPLYKELGAELRVCAMVQRMFKYPRLFRFFVNKVNKSPTFKLAVSSMFNEFDLYAALMKPSFYVRIIFNR